MAKVDERIVYYIEKELRKGFSEELVKAALIKAGHHPEHIDFHLAHVRKKKSRFIVSIIGSAAFMFMISFFLYLLFFNNGRDFNKLTAEGNILCGQGQYEEAMEKFDRAIKLNASSPKGYAFEGYCLLKQNKYSEAIRELEKAGYQNRLINNQNRNPNYRFALGKAYCGAGKHKEGIEQLNRAIALNSSSMVFHEALAECNLKLGGNETQAMQK